MTCNISRAAIIPDLSRRRKRWDNHRLSQFLAKGFAPLYFIWRNMRFSNADNFRTDARTTQVLC